MSRLIAWPSLVAVIADQDLREIGRQIDELGADANAIELNLAQIPANRIPELEDIIRRAKPPLYTAYRRREFMEVYGYRSDELELVGEGDRIKRQLEVPGAAGVDIEFEMRGSREFIREAHAQHREVVLSAHTGRSMNQSESLRLAEDMRDAGADVVKIIHSHSEPDYCTGLYSSMLLLRERLGVPFTLSSIGPGSAVIRRMACHLGSSYAFARPASAERFYPGHAPLPDMRALFEAFPPSLALRDVLIPAASQ